VSILLVLLLYVAFYRITGRGRHLPDHVRNAPVAELVWPGPFAIGEIEMSAREFRETRRPKLLPGGTAKTVSPAAEPILKTHEAHSSVRSPYHSAPSDAAIAQEKNPRPRRPLESPNFSPKPELDPPKSSLSNIAVRSFGTRELPGDQVPKSFASLPPKTFAPNTPSSSIASKSVLPPKATKATKTRIDSKIELASAESDGNDFVPSLPSMIDVPPVKTTATDLPSNSFQLATAKANQFSPAEFNLNTIQEINADQPADDASKLKVETTQSTPNQIEPILRPHKSALNMAGQSLSSLSEGITKPSSGDLVDPFLDPDPTLVPCRPAENPGKKTMGVKRLPSPEPNWTTATLPDSSLESTSVTTQQYITEPGDSFWSISQTIYNDGRYFRALYKYNQSHVPEFNSLKPGTKIGTPARADLIKLWPDLCPDAELRHLAQRQAKPESSDNRIYITQRGDTVFDIARQRLGQASRYSEILKLNQVDLGLEASHLTPLEEGVWIVLPQ